MSGAAKRMAYTFIKLFGKKKEEEAMAITGFFVSIPIFCDSGFVILSPIAKAIAKVVNKSVVAIGAALAAGLVITHTMVPPTPGPLGVAGIFSIDVGTFILINLVLSIPMVLGVLFYAKTYLTKNFDLVPNDKGLLEKIVGDYNPDAALNEDDSNLPSAFMAFAPLVLPIILILMNTILSALGLKEGIFNIIIFLGQPIIAVGIDLLVAIATLIPTVDKETAVKEMEKGMASAGIILLVTGAGGALGQIIKDS